MSELDNNKVLSGIKVYNEFTPFLIENWQSLYKKGANYNLSYEWCSLWFKYFNKGKELFVITYWEEGNLKLLAPFYKKRNTISLIGAKPDLYDEFNIIYESEKYIIKLLDYIKSSGIQVNFRHVNLETPFAKRLIKWFTHSGIGHKSNVTETKPCIVGEFKPSKNLKHDVKKCTNNAGNFYNSELEFIFNVDRNEKTIKEFIELHKKRWDGGMLVKKANVDKFIEDIFLNTDLITLSCLKLTKENKAIAYLMGYIDSSNIFWSSMSAYNFDYKKISPGKVLLYRLIEESYKKGIVKFDFGRGSEGYKTWFANYDEALFNVATYNNKYYFKITRLAEKILKLLFA